MNHYTQSLTEQELYVADEKKLSNEKEEIDHMTFRDFYKLIDDLKKANPTYRPQDYKKLMKSDEYKEDYDDIVKSFLDDFGDLDMSNEYYRDVVIALSTIGIEIPRKINNITDNKEDAISNPESTEQRVL